MTERSARHLRRDATSLALGPSAIAWDGRRLTLDIDERGAPWPSRVTGRLTIEPRALHATAHPLDADGRHRWTPIAPLARVAVDFARPASRWHGHAYVDTNAGDRPLERDFARWHWSRRTTADGGATILYDVERADGSRRAIALAFPADGGAPGAVDPPPPVALPSSRWGIARRTRADAGAGASVVRTLEDGPFYARSIVRASLFGEIADAVHESLDLTRFARPWVQAMLPFRVPRRG